MILWKYTIKGDAGTIFTKNPVYAEEKSKQGYRIFCKRENTIMKFYQ